MPNYISFDVRLDSKEESNEFIILVIARLIVNIKVFNIGFDERRPVGVFPSGSLAEISPIRERGSRLPPVRVLLHNVKVRVGRVGIPRGKGAFTNILVD